LKGSPAKAGRGSDMQSKLQSIQTGKAYLEKKIQEYESRLSQMKQKKMGRRSAAAPPSPEHSLDPSSKWKDESD